MNPRSANYVAGMVGLITLTVLGLLLVLCLIAGGSITGDAPPSSGDWTIDNPTTVRSERLEISGNITVNSVLTLGDSTVLVDSPSDLPFTIVVAKGGNLVASDSLFTPLNKSNGYGFLVQGKMDLDRTVLEGCWMGLRIETGERVTVNDCTVLNASGRGLHLVKATDTTIEDTALVLNDMTGFSLSATLPDTTSYSTTVTSAAIQVTGGSPVLRGIDLYLNGEMRGRASFDKQANYGYVYVYWYFYMLYIDSDSSAEVQGLNIINGTVNFCMDYQLNNSYSSSSYWYTRSYYYATAVNVPNYRDVTLSGLDLSSVGMGSSRTTSQYTGYPINNHYVYDYPQTMKLIEAVIDKSYTTAGPHRSSLTLANIDFGQMASTFSPLVKTHLYTAYTGTTPPTFDSRIVLDKVNVDGGKDVFAFGETPGSTFTMFKTYYMYVRISNSTFTNLTGRLCTPTYTAGPGIGPGTKSFYLFETLLVENNLFKDCRQGSTALFYYAYSSSYERNNCYDRYNWFRGNTFESNVGRLFDMQGRSYQDMGGKERTILDGNLFLNNKEASADYLLYNYYRETVSIVNNRFVGNSYSYGIYLHCAGGDLNGKKPSDYVIRNNTFRSTNSPMANRPWIDVNWGGSMEVSYNNISDIETWFLRATEYTAASLYASIDFHHNEISNNNGTMVWLAHTGQYHPKLTLTVDHNKAWNNGGPIIDYLVDSNLDNYDYNAKIIIRNNSIYGSTGSVFKTYGEVIIEDNYFQGCSGYAVDLSYMYLSPPIIARNKVKDCGDIYSIVGKDKAGLKMALSMSDIDIDCTGNAFYFRNLVVTLKRIDVTPRATVAIIAEESNVDVVQSQVPIGSGKVIGSGAINVWYSIELWVTWGDASGEDTQRPVAEALVIRNTVAGGYYGSDLTDAEGHLKPIRYPQWSIKESFFTMWSPYTISVAKSGAMHQYSIDLNKDFVGTDSLHFLLIDSFEPEVAITSHFDGDQHSVDDLTVQGFVMEIGSGLREVTVSCNLLGQPEGEPIPVTVMSDGSFAYTLTDLPEGVTVIHVRAVDQAMNSNHTSVTLTIDRTPPSLAILEPIQDMVTREPLLTVTVSFEPGAVVLLNGVEMVSTSGLITDTMELVEGSNEITVQATDAAGNVAHATRVVLLDRYAPPFTLLTPVDGLLTAKTRLVVKGDTEVGTVLRLSVHGPARAINDMTLTVMPDGTFSQEVQLEEGRNELVLVASDEAGNSARAERVVYVDTTAPSCTIQFPPDLYSTRDGTVQVRGTVDEDATMLVNGVPVTHDGDFEATVPLVEGPNVIAVRVIDPLGNERSYHLTVTMDTEPPTIHLLEPTSRSVKTNVAQIRVMGTVTGGATSLTIGGKAVQVGSLGAFDHMVTLTHEGITEVAVVSIDAAGNEATVTITVDLSTSLPTLTASYDPDSTSVKAADNTLTIVGQTTPGISWLEVLHTIDGQTRSFTFYPLEATGDFTVDVRLAEGENVVVLRVVDAYGNVRETDPHTVTFKSTAPSQGAEEDTAGLDLGDLGIIIVALSIALVVTAILVMWALGRRD